MRFSDDLLAEIKNRLPASAVIGRSVNLKRNGREYAGLSPFNKEKTPSFFVNDDKQFFHCFSSGKHGDIFKFLMETERLSFPEAVERLAREAGVRLPAPDAEADKKDNRRKDMVAWVDLAAQFFEQRLRSREGEEARRYLIRRHVPEAAWPRFRLGFAPADRTQLRDFLLHKGAELDTLVEAGLLIRPDDGRKPFDRFSNRLMFPIADPGGRLVAFGGRTLEPDGKPKYLNSPETDLFQKGRLLYRYPEARKALGADAKKSFIVVEGYMDVVALELAGFAGAVAPLGTALTEEQIQLLWRAQDMPVLCFDGDAAGQRAAHRAVERALPILKPDKSLVFAFLPEGLDPDDMIRQHGVAGMRNVLNSTKPLVKQLVELEESLHPLDSPERMAGMRARLRQRVKTILDADVRIAYERTVFDMLNPKRAVQAPSVEGDFRRSARSPQIVSRFGRNRGRDNLPDLPQGGPSAALKLDVASKRTGQTQADAHAFDVLARIFAAPELMEDVSQALMQLDPMSAPLDRIRNALLDAWIAGHDFAVAGLEEAPSVRHLLGSFGDHLGQDEDRVLLTALDNAANWARRAREQDPDTSLEQWRDSILRAEQEFSWSRELKEAGSQAGDETDQDALRRLTELARAKQGIVSRSDASRPTVAERDGSDGINDDD